MNQILIYDKLDKQFSKVKRVLQDYMGLTQTSVLGGEDTLTFSVPVQLAGDIQTDDFITFEQKRYIITRESKDKNEEGVYYEYSCEGLYTMLMHYYIDGEDTWMAGATFRSVLERILRGTPFSVGHCDDFGTWDIELKDLNCLEAINEARSNWPKKAELYFDGYVINARVVRGNDTGYQLHYDKNLDTIERIIDSSTIVTRFVGLGANGLTIEGLKQSEIPEEYQAGVHFEGGIVSEKYIDSDNIADYAYPKRYQKELGDYTNQLDLLKAMQKFLSARTLPTVTYNVSYIEMVRAGVPYSDIDVGDFVILNDPDFGALKLRVAEIKKDPLFIEKSTVTLGERYRTLEDYLSDFDASKEIIESIDPGALDQVQGELDDLKDILNGGNNTVFITESDGIICADKSTLGPGNTIINTTKLIKMANGGIGSSVDGGQSYVTGLDYEGVKAEAIRSGYIGAGHITVGDASKFEDGYKPEDVRKPLLTQFDVLKENVSTNIGNVEKEVDVINTSVAQTNTAMNLVKKELVDKIDILNKDVSGLNGDVNSVVNMYNKVNDDLYGNSYFRWNDSGLHAIDYDNPNHQMRLTAKGIGLSRDGGKIFDNAITARGINASQITLGRLNEGPFKGLAVHNGLGQETFAIDTNGNLSMMGNINMQGGSINWQNVSKITYDALDPALRDKYTWIDSNGVYTGTVQAKQLNLKDGHFNVTNKAGETTFSIDPDGNTMIRGNVYMGRGSVLDWSQLNKPTLEELGAASGSDLENFKTMANQRFTHITPTGLYTGDIDAGSIKVTGHKIPLDFVEGAAGKADITNALKDVDSKISSGVSTSNDYATNLANSLSRDLANLEKNIDKNVTQITHNAVSSATIMGNQIKGGTISGVQMYCDDHLIVGSQVGSRYPKIQFRPDDNFNAIVQKDGYLAVQADGLALWGGDDRIYVQSSWNNTLFSKSGSSRPGSGTYVSMHQIIAKINELCRKNGLTQL